MGIPIDIMKRINLHSCSFHTPMADTVEILIKPLKYVDCTINFSSHLESTLGALVEKIYEAGVRQGKLQSSEVIKTLIMKGS